jgi:hypothetical protein
VSIEKGGFTMRFHLRVTSIAFAMLIAGSVHAQSHSAKAEVMLPGLWEITVQTVSPIKGPLLTHTVCIDKEHVTRPDPPKSKPKDDCQALPDTAAANETAYTVRCAKQKVTSSSRFTYSGDHFEGTVTINKEDVVINQVYSAKRVSDCDDVVERPTGPPAN